MNILDRLYEQEYLIECMNRDIENLLDEDAISLNEFDASFLKEGFSYEPWQIKLFRRLGAIPQDIPQILDKHGKVMATIEKDAAEMIEPEIEIEVGPDPELAALLSRHERNMALSQDIIDRQPDEKEGRHQTTDREGREEGKQSYNNIKINFRGTNELTVKIGRGKVIKEKLSGTMDFRIDTIKETSRGYIMNLYNKRYFDRDTSLLLYCKNLDSSTQTNILHIIYENGKFVGSPQKVSFAIIDIS